MVDESGLAIETTDMMSETPISMGSSEYEMIELFRKINVSRPIALTLACLAKGREISSQSIEMVSGLRQPKSVLQCGTSAKTTGLTSGKKRNQKVRADRSSCTD